LPGVMELIRVTKPYKLASREMHEADTHVEIPLRDQESGISGQGPGAASRHSAIRNLQSAIVIGPGTFTIIAGPCSVESEAMILRTAEYLRQRGVRLMRAGAFKPRSSPYS